MKEDKTWYVIYTRPRWEKKVALLLEDAGIEHYCPLNKVSRQWSDRKKVVMEPLFKGYVFVQIAETEKVAVRSISGVLNFVHWNNTPAKVQPEEIDQIRKFLKEFDNVEVLNLQLENNDEVEITEGLMMNYKGIVLEVVANKARVLITSMGLQLRAVFEKRHLKKVGL